MSLAIGDIVWVAYPYVETNRMRSRPAVIVAVGLGEAANLCWASMITNAARPAWPGDVVITDHEAAGLPIPSKVRTGKIATLAVSRANVIGHMPGPEMTHIAARLSEALAWIATP
ncbi:hypothetical protein GCM10011395_27040 [Sphingomonas psychrolutea]|uniref:Type II toxin-antitoxin system PemK/MazF family toxin n=1 Tax=Sphingomonas psychrolutea TaxID=1259676 RepID=A0ABQ1H177_9SPHN|nr:hypothetical protein GCM10011395_27040 [Sphingomonas psychrolutea]